MHRKSFVALSCAVALTFAGIVRADVFTNDVVKGSQAQINSLGLGVIVDGTGKRIAIAEVGGEAEISPVNGNMQAAGNGNGQINLLTALGTTDHATTVAGTSFSLAPQSPMVLAGSGVIDGPNSLISWSQLMLQNGGGGNNAPILNWSWHTLTGKNVAPVSNGLSTETEWMDWASITQAAHPIADKVIVVAGNETPNATFEGPGGTLDGVRQRQAPWDNYNGITVAATAGNNSLTLATYNGGVANFGGGFNGYTTRNVTTDNSPYGNGRHRFKTDISAPGGGDGNTLFAPVKTGSALDNFAGGVPNNGLNSNPNWGGTSFAAPHVAAGAALLEQYGSAKAFSTDHRLVKALLLNGANKDSLRNNSRALGDQLYRPAGLQPQLKNGNSIFIGWDEDMGTGQMDISASLLNYSKGRDIPGNVAPTGWDLNNIFNEGTSNAYNLAMPVGGFGEIRATLAWDRFMKLNDSNADNLYQQTAAETFAASALNDLDLEIWDLTLNQRVFFSTSDIDSIEHVDYIVPNILANDLFSIRVKFFKDWVGNGLDGYGLAWTTVNAPEPIAGAVVVFGVFMLRQRRRS